MKQKLSAIAMVFALIVLITACGTESQQPAGQGISTPTAMVAVPMPDGVEGGATAEPTPTDALDVAVGAASPTAAGEPTNLPEVVPAETPTPEAAAEPAGKARLIFFTAPG